MLIAVHVHQDATGDRDRERERSKQNHHVTPSNLTLRLFKFNDRAFHDQLFFFHFFRRHALAFIAIAHVSKVHEML